MTRPRRSAARLTLIAGCALALAGPAAARQDAQDLRNQPVPDRPALAEQPAIVGEGDEQTIGFGRFSEPVELASLVDFIGRTLDVNIILTEADLSGRAVEFKAPVQVRREELLPLLQTLLAQQGFGLTETDEGWLMVAPADRLPVTLEGALATTRVFPTPLVKPSALTEAINTMLGGSGQGQGQGRRIAYVDELGVIISTAPPRVNESLSRIIDRLLAEQAGIRMRRFDLTHVAAQEARQRLLELVGQSQPGGARPAGAPAGGQQAPGAGGGAGQALANLADRLYVDRQSNALIFRGSEREAEELATLVQIVDAPSRLIIRRYPAGRMSRTIASYGERLGLGPVAGGGGGGAGAAPTGAGQAFVGSGFVIEGGEDEPGSFTYYGTQQQHDRVSALVEEFADQVRNQQMVVEFYRLENASAEEAAGLLNELLELETADEVGSSPFVTRSLEGGNIRRVSDFGVPTDSAAAQQGQQAAAGEGAGEDGAPSLTPAEGVAIIADIPRNQIIVKAPVRQQKEIEQIIRKIDLRRGQVYIEAQFVAVSTSTDFSITVETVLTDPDSDVPIFTNFGLLSDPTADPSSPNVRLPLGSGLSSALINNDYVPLVIQALQTEGDGRLLSQPRLLVNDNEEAELAATQNEPFAQTTQVVGAPSQTSLGGTISAGTTLSVRPQISEGGFVRLEFSAELSAFGERPSPDLPPSTTSDTLTSAVTVPSDTTVVLGGFTQQSEQDSVSKIPILGDIPLLGWLFRSTTKEQSYRTIYIFITPRVLRDPSFADLRLLTKGPAEDLEAPTAFQLPELEPAVMPILGALAEELDEAEEEEAAEPAVTSAIRREDEDASS